MTKKFTEEQCQNIIYAGDNKTETYYVTQEQLGLIEELKKFMFPLYQIATNRDKYNKLICKFPIEDEKALLRYLGGDEIIEFKVKEPLYRLWRVDSAGDMVFMNFAPSGNPDWTIAKELAFTSPLDEITKWKTPAWEIEEAN